MLSADAALMQGVGARLGLALVLSPAAAAFAPPNGAFPRASHVQRHPWPVAQDTIIEADPLADGEHKRRIFEICTYGPEGEIDGCRIVEEGIELVEAVGAERAAEMLSDRSEADLYFEKESSSTANAEDVLLTTTDWQASLDDDVANAPDDVLLKALGPDAFLALKERDQEHAEVSLDRDLRHVTEAEAQTKPRFHLHFGAGRLGMGLVVPAIAAAGTPFAIVQRPKRKWIELFHREGAISSEDTIVVTNNEQVVVNNVEVVQGADGPPSVVPPLSLMFGSQPEELEEFVRRATSFSCSLGSAMGSVVTPLLTMLPRTRLDEQPLLFCCENDHEAVSKLKQQLAGHVRVVDCMVDRVCTGRTISAEGVDVATEPWRGSIVVLEPDLNDRLPFHPKIATAPSTAAEAEYLSERKFTLVNGMHTTLAFMTLAALFRENDGGCEYILLKYTKVPRDQQCMIEAWRTVRVAQLIDQFGIENLMSWHGCDTREEAWEVLLAHADHVLEERFSTTDDVVSRVLGGGVANRWSTRLLPTHEWLEGALEQEDGSSELLDLFQYAVERDRERALARGCSIEDAQWRGCEVECSTPEFGECGATSWPLVPAAQVAYYIRELTMTSRRFCSREREITHKGLIQQQRKAGGKANAPETRAAMARQQGMGI